MSFETLKRHKAFGGETLFCQHQSASTQTTMKFSVHKPCPPDQVDSALIWLSGLTCTEENFITKAGAQKVLAGTTTMVICPDTSPRGLGIPGSEDSYDFGTGAGFYLNATTDLYKNNYNMYDYITKDLVTLLKGDFGVSRFAISGHSMGGHGALVIGLREPELFASVSAFSPIVNPVASPWGQKAFTGYLGDDKELWKQYDACELIEAGHRFNGTLLVEQGLSDDFLKEQLLTNNLETTCSKADQSFKVNYREGYDHSYYFISSFIEDHIQHHLQYLQN